MNANDAASIAEIASAALADLFDEELRAMGAAGIAALEDRLPAGEGPSLGTMESENQHVYGVRVVGARRVGHGSAALPVGVGLTDPQDDQG